MRALPGVLSVEPFRSVASRIRYGHHERRVSITGLTEDARLNRLLDASGVPVPLPPSGLLLSAKLAEILDVRAGDVVRVEVQEGRRPAVDVVDAGTITDIAGIAAYMNVGPYQRMIQEGRALSGVHLAVDAVRWNDFLERVKETPRIGTVTPTRAARESFERTMADMIGNRSGHLFQLCGDRSFGVVYNGARIALSSAPAIWRRCVCWVSAAKR
jgi:putative ABC transport system permease protein